MRFLFFIVIIIAAIACADKRQEKPKNLLNKTSMTAILSDVLVADAVATEIKTRDSLINLNALSAAYYQQIFKIHNISKEQFTSSYNYYVSHPDEFKEVLDSATNVLNKKMASDRKPISVPAKTAPPKVPHINPKLKNKK
ncbi:MAG: DUF4296 domain-containing protein [Sphingobacteriales bacterium]|nr:DUF4296 domain-containing protein [Sphingobacteriales bacterium]MBI3718832.1 DUF4296 domain-containing protein [Sphingobacteriales bacterium]